MMSINSTWTHSGFVRSFSRVDPILQNIPQVEVPDRKTICPDRPRLPVKIGKICKISGENFFHRKFHA